MTWADAVAPDLTGTVQSVSVSGSEAAPAVLAFALVALAASAATALSSAWVRLVTGPVLIAAGIGASWAAVSVLVDPSAASARAVSASTGVLGGEVLAQSTLLPALALVPALGVTLLGLLVLLVGGSWPVGTRYRSAALTRAADPSQDPAGAWDALTRGEDPSTLEDEDPETPQGESRHPGATA